MENILARCAGLDVHKDSVEAVCGESNRTVACIVRHANGERSAVHIAAIARSTGSPERRSCAPAPVADWLAAEGVTNVASESLVK
jgi:hypothetical protein